MRSEETLREELEGDAAELTRLLRHEWQLLPDPFGSVMLVPVGAEGDPCLADELPWPAITAAFRDAHGRPPRPGARALAARRLVSPRPVGGGLDG